MAGLIDDIRRAVEASGQTRYAIAKASGISQGQLSRLVNGERGMAVDTIERLADYLGYRIVIERDTNIKFNRITDTKKHSAGKARKGA